VVESDNEFSLFESVANVPVISPTSPYYIALVSYLAIAGVFGARNQKGVAVKHLHLENLRRLPIPLAPKYEQQEITETLEAILSVIDQQDKIVSENLKKADALRQSILKQTFSGKLVEQDPKDEPTSVLLERIKREKENTKKKKRRVA
jgi:restriction endonuclease S subunit